jgi:hypothetical protein
MANAHKPGLESSHRAAEPHVGEHGEWGYDTGPVGGFGENYDAQVARGLEPTLPDASPAQAELASAVQKALAQAHVDAADLRVDVNGNNVTLYGSVRDELEKTQLEALAREVPGVSFVTSRLNVANGFRRAP